MASTGRLTVPADLDGLYSIGGNIDWAVNNTGVRYVSVVYNGLTEVDIATVTMPTAPANHTRMNINTQWQASAGDYFELRAYQSSGGALNVGNEQAWSCEFWLARV